jgi:hypothetical protein
MSGITVGSAHVEEVRPRAVSGELEFESKYAPHCGSVRGRGDLPLDVIICQ